MLICFDPVFGNFCLFVFMQFVFLCCLIYIIICFEPVFSNFCLIIIIIANNNNNNNILINITEGLHCYFQFLPPGAKFYKFELGPGRRGQNFTPPEKPFQVQRS